jgi:hypothetical protein
VQLRRPPDPVPSQARCADPYAASVRACACAQRPALRAWCQHDIKTPAPAPSALLFEPDVNMTSRWRHIPYFPLHNKIWKTLQILEINAQESLISSRDSPAYIPPPWSPSCWHKKCFMCKNISKKYIFQKFIAFYCKPRFFQVRLITKTPAMNTCLKADDGFGSKITEGLCSRATHGHYSSVN